MASDSVPSCLAWNAADVDLILLQNKIQTLYLSEDVETELFLTALRACWLWNAADAD